MSLTGLSFLLIYFPILFFIYYIPFFSIEKKNIILLLASMGLYAFVQPAYVVILVLSIIFNYLLVTLMRKYNNSFWGIMGIGLDVAILAFFKYYNYFLVVFFSEKSSSMQILIPIGISYFTFREISYIADCMKDRDIDKGSLCDVALYISNFFCIVAGPLENYYDAIKNNKNRTINRSLIFIGAKRCSKGLIKKVMIADSLASLVSYCYSAENISMLMAWIGAIAYSLQLYFDFSGYTDVVIGMGNLFGFEFPENFNLPYCARSVSDFWKRWHMSLTKWFTKYLYITLGGSRVKSVCRHIFNLFIVWLATGVWHGSSLNFLLWAMIYFILQLIEKYTDFITKLEIIHLNRIYTMFVIIICWAIFRASSLVEALAYVGKLFGLGTSSAFLFQELGFLKYYVIPLFFGTFLAFGGGNIIRKLQDKSKATGLIIDSIVFLLTVGSLILIYGRGYSAPLYANF